MSPLSPLSPLSPFSPVALGSIQPAYIVISSVIAVLKSNLVPSSFHQPVKSNVELVGSSMFFTLSPSVTTCVAKTSSPFLKVTVIASSLILAYSPKL